MNVEQARTKLNSVTKSIATKHPKVLISELCNLVKFLLDEIERIKSPPMKTLIAECPCDRDPSDDRGYQPKRSLPPTPELPMPPTTTPPLKPYVFPTTTCDEPLTE